MLLYLADTSAWNWCRRAFTRWGDLLETGQIATCAPVKLELLCSARGSREYAQLSSDLGGLPYIELDERTADAALGAQRKLAARGHHRIPAVDLLVAALAEINGLVVLHYDKHFDAIGRATGQRTKWLAPRGSLD